MLDAELHDGRIVVAELLDARQKRLGQFRAAELDKPFGLGAREDRKNARDDRDTDPKGAGEVIVELEKVGVIEKKLGDDEVGAGGDFFAEKFPVRMLALLAGNVSLGESGGADGKAVELAQKADQFA